MWMTNNCLPHKKIDLWPKPQAITLLNSVIHPA